MSEAIHVRFTSATLAFRHSVRWEHRFGRWFLVERSKDNGNPTHVTILEVRR